MSAAAVAQVLLPRYGLPADTTISLLTVGDNDNYIVNAPEGRTLCRVYCRRDTWADAASQHRFELEWMAWLSAREVGVSRPLPTIDGEWLCDIDTPEGERYLALWEWVDGKPGDPADPELARAYGRDIATLHLASRGFSSAQYRNPLSVETLALEPLRRITDLTNQLGLSAERDAFVRLAEPVVALAERLPQTESHYGILHGDFNTTNHHLVDGRAVFFDADLCGAGWWMYDIAVCLWSLVRTGTALDSIQTIAANIMRGYHSVRPVQRDELMAMDALMTGRHYWVMGEHVADVPVLGAQRVGPAYWRAALMRLRELEACSFSRQLCAALGI